MLIQCPECGFSRAVDESAVPAGSCFATCPKCSFRFRFRAEQPGGEKEAPRREKARAYQRAAGGGKTPLLSPGGSAPWECPGGFLRPKGFVHTLGMLARNVTAFFAGLNPFSSIIPSWIFLLLCNTPFITHTVLQLSEATLLLPGTQEPVSLLSLTSLPELIGIPILLITLHQFISSLLIYGAARFIEPGQANFRLIFKASAYAKTPMLLILLPFIGSWLALVLSTSLLFLGVRHACRLSWPKTAIAIIPLLLLTFFVTVYLLKAASTLGQAPL